MSNICLGACGALDLVNRLGAAGKYDRLGMEALDLGSVDVAGEDLGVHADFAHATCNQLGVLRPEVKDEHAVRMYVGHQPIR